MNQNKRGVSEEKPSPVVVGLDIGTTKIAVIAGRKMPSGKIQILGYGRTESSGVDMAQVRNIQEVRMAVAEAVSRCEYNVFKRFQTALKIREVCVGVAGHHVNTRDGYGRLLRGSGEAHKEFVEADVRSLFEQQYLTKIDAGREILHVLPKYYKVDGFKTLQPVGCNGHKLEGYFHIVTVDKDRLNNIKLAVEGAGLSVQSWHLQPLASARATMSKQELESGVMVMDIGGGTSDIAVYKEGVLQFARSLPLGGKLITTHIKEYFSILEEQAEAVKKELGCALVEKVESPHIYANIPPVNGLPGKEISIYGLANVIQADLDKLAHYVNVFFADANVDKSSLVGGVILTGGGAQMKHLRDFVALRMAMPSRSTSHMSAFEPDFPVDLQHSSYSTCVGLLISGFQEYEDELKIRESEEQESEDSREHSLEYSDEFANTTLNRVVQNENSNYTRQDFGKQGRQEVPVMSSASGVNSAPENYEQYGAKTDKNGDKAGGGIISSWVSKVKGTYDSFLDNMFGDFKDENIQ